MKTKNALLVIYTFPPTGGAGVQRAVKFSKYLPLNDINLTVLTVKKILYHVYDDSLLKEIHPSVEVVRTRSWDPLRLSFLMKIFLQKIRKNTENKEVSATKSVDTTQSNFASKLKHLYRYLSKIIFFIDAQILWMPFAIAKGLQKIKKNNIDVIVSMSQPNSLILTCYLMSKLSGKTLVLDMRDPWTNDPYFKPPTALHFKVYRWIERKAILHAKSVVVISNSMKEAIVRYLPSEADKIKVIPNGYDSEDMIVRDKKVNDKVIINYTGSLYFHHEPALRLFIDSIEKAITKDASIRKKLKIRFVGNVEDSNKIIIQNSSISSLFDLKGYVKHKEAIEYTLEADVLLLFIKLDLDRDKDTVTIPGKFFEYLGSRKPILYIGPKSETSDIIKETGQGWCPNLDINSIGEIIKDITSNDKDIRINEEMIRVYDRKEQAKVFASFLKEL